MLRTVYTIGHSTHEEGAFVSLLERHGVTAVADVRSAPFSRRVPHFSKAPLQALLRAAGLAYVFLGRELGARTDDESCYVGERVEFDRLALGQHVDVEAWTLLRPTLRTGERREHGGQNG